MGSLRLVGARRSRWAIGKHGRRSGRGFPVGGRGSWLALGWPLVIMDGASSLELRWIRTARVLNLGRGSCPLITGT